MLIKAYFLLLLATAVYRLYLTYVWIPLHPWACLKYSVFQNNSEEMLPVGIYGLLKLICYIFTIILAGYLIITWNL